MNHKSGAFCLCFFLFLCQYSFAQIRPSFSGFVNTDSGSESNNENAYIFDPAAVSGNGTDWPGVGNSKLYKHDFGGLSNSEFIDYALNLMKDTSSIHCMVVVYSNNSQQNIDFIVAKQSLNTAYHKPSTSTGQQVYVLSEYLASASANIGIAYTTYSFVVN
jgi:hypothetical protein